MGFTICWKCLLKQVALFVLQLLAGQLQPDHLSHANPGKPAEGPTASG